MSLPGRAAATTRLSASEWQSRFFTAEVEPWMSNLSDDGRATLTPGATRNLHREAYKPACLVLMTVLVLLLIVGIASVTIILH